MQLRESAMISRLMTQLRVTPQAVAPRGVSAKAVHEVESPWSGLKQITVSEANQWRNARSTWSVGRRLRNSRKHATACPTDKPAWIENWISMRYDGAPMVRAAADSVGRTAL